MILFEFVLFGMGLQMKVWDTDDYGKRLEYFEISGGNKGGAPWILKKFHFNISLYRGTYGYDWEGASKIKVLTASFCGKFWRKEWERPNFIEPQKESGKTFAELVQRAHDEAEAAVAIPPETKEFLLKKGDEILNATKVFFKDKDAAKNLSA